LDDALDEFGVSTASGLFGIEVEDCGVELEFPGWSWMDGDDEDSPLTLIRDPQ
jgi:hypothetical protein